MINYKNIPNILYPLSDDWDSYGVRSEYENNYINTYSILEHSPLTISIISSSRCSLSINSIRARRFVVGILVDYRCKPYTDLQVMDTAIKDYPNGSIISFAFV